ncbi:MAG: TolC family protein, partial [Mariprofundaceae bacterium]|nr:TolC family protein [Mariprofundaceae bacterium]
MQYVFSPYIFSFLAVFLPNLVMAGEPLTLKQAELLAVQQNPGLSATGRQAEAMANVSAQVGSLPDPVLSLNALNLPVDSFSTTAENMTQMQVGFSQMIPFPGKLGLRASVADYMADAAILDVDEFKLQLIASVKGSWWNMFYLDHAIETVHRNKQLLRQFIRIAETKYKVGQGLQQDVLLAQLELSKLLDVAIQLKAARKQQEARFNALLNRPARLSIALPQTAGETLPTLASESELAELALKNRPLLAKHDRFIDAAHDRVILAEKDYYPDFNLGGVYGFRSGVNAVNNQSRPDFASIRLSMTLPFFTSSKQHHRLDQRKAELSRSEFSSQDAKVFVLAEVSQTLAAYQRAKEQATLFRTGIIPQATQTVASMLAGYQV